ncbi:hypothetical protein JTB14_024993 [Gonioctena quinquepunctata]|nr:hypothetical protein JTB14_024993 [Gonioctena quinquepunctata]
MAGNWNLDDPVRAVAALDYYFSLPDDEIISEQDEDINAIEQMQELVRLYELNNSFQAQMMKHQKIRKMPPTEGRKRFKPRKT